MNSSAGVIISFSDRLTAGAVRRHMLNYLWAGMILTGIIYASFTGNVDQVSLGALDSAKEAVTLCVSMVGVMALWTGLMEIAKKSGLVEQMTRAVRPLVDWLFPDIPKKHESKEHISTNIIANFLGLGWAATPSGLKAMEALAALEEERRSGKSGSGCLMPRPAGTASNEMCNFLILNISSLQLIPVNIIAYRSQYGSANPTAIVGPAIAATAVSTAAAVLFCKVMDRRSCI